MALLAQNPPPIGGLWKTSPSYLFEKVPLTRAFDGTTF
jgi:hypothetical protein